MNQAFRLMELIGEVNDRYIEESCVKPARKHRMGLWPYMIAAALALALIGGGTAFLRWGGNVIHGQSAGETASESAMAAEPAEAPAEPKTKNKVVSTASYFWLMFLYSIPVIGFFALVIMAFTAKNRNIRNFCKAILTWILVGLVVCLVLGIIAVIFSKQIGISWSDIDFNTIWQGIQDGLGIIVE